MQHIARIHNGSVAERTTLPDEVALVDAFHPSLIFIACPEEVEVGWVWDGKEFSPPVASEPSEDELRMQRQRAYADAMRAGCSVKIGNATVVVGLDGPSINSLAITAARAAIESDPTGSYSFAGQSMSVADLKTVIGAVDDYVRQATTALRVE